MNRRELHVYFALLRAYRRGKAGEPQPIHHDVRDVLGELDAEPGMHTVSTHDDLDALRPDTVIRDADGSVYELWQSGSWMPVGGEEGGKPQLPAFVLAEGAS